MRKLTSYGNNNFFLKLKRSSARSANPLHITPPTAFSAAKLSNFSSNFDYLYSSWCDERVAEGFYASTNMQPATPAKAKNMRHGGGYPRPDYLIYLVLQSTVVGIRRVVFVDRASTLTKNCLKPSAYADLTLNSVLLVESWTVVGVLQSVFEPVETALHTLCGSSKLPQIQAQVRKHRNYLNKFTVLRFKSRQRWDSYAGKLHAPQKLLRTVRTDVGSNIRLFDGDELCFRPSLDGAAFRLPGGLYSLHQSVSTLTSIYSSLFIRNPLVSLFTDLGGFSKVGNSGSGALKTAPLFKLIFKFKNAYLYITLLDKNRKDRRSQIFFTLHTGMFLKFFNFKKSLKKSKSFKVLLMRYLRKLLLVTGINNFYLYVRQTSDSLSKLLHVLQKPTTHVFVDPLTGKSVCEQSKPSRRSREALPTFDFVYAIFRKPQPFGIMRTRKVGRIKRKIQRKVIKLNNIID